MEIGLPATYNIVTKQWVFEGSYPPLRGLVHASSYLLQCDYIIPKERYKLYIQYSLVDEQTVN